MSTHICWIDFRGRQAEVFNLFYPFKEAHVDTYKCLYAVYTVYFYHFEIAHGHVFLRQTVYDVSTKFVGCELIDTFSL